MDSNQLREACETAGMDVVTNDLSGPRWGVKTNLLHAREPVTIWAVREGREWIESRCADILVGKAELSFDAYWQTSGRYVVHLNFPENVAGDFWGDTLAESVITAALAVLKGVGND